MPLPAYLKAAIAFFPELGLELEGETTVEGESVGRLVGLDGVQRAGNRRIMFAVDDIDETVARLRAHGAELIGEVTQYENIYRPCHLRGPEGIMIALAAQID